MIKKSMRLYGLLGRQRDVLVIFFLSLALYSLFRLEFLVWNWPQYRHLSGSDLLIALLVGLRFDVSANSYLAFPLFLLAFLPWSSKVWPRLVFSFFFLIQIPLLVLNSIDAEFVNFVGRRFTKQSLFIFGEAPGKLTSIFGTYLPGIFLQLAVFCLFFIFIWKNLHKAPFENFLKKSSTGLRSGLVILFLIVFYTVGSRGGLQKKPVSFVDANVFTAPVLNNLILNTSFTVLKSLSKDPVAQEKFFSKPAEFLPYLNGSVPRLSLLEGKRPQQPQNVVIIIMESFALEYMGQVNGVKGYTPFLDQLASSSQSLFFKNGIANARRSIEGIAAVMTGIPALMSEPFISSEFTTNHFVGLGSYLGPLKYHSSFFHGGMNGTMHFDSFMKSVGIENYFGALQFPEAGQDDGAWGIYDEPFFQFFANKLSEFPQPFVSGFFSLSSHHPYRIPEKYKDQFAEGPIEILRAISYADFSLKNFFAQAEKQDWYKNTLFVITADHTQKGYLPAFDNEIAKWKIPVLFFHPQFSWPEVDRDQIVQQIDVLPSVLDFLNVKPKEDVLLGRSVFIPGERTATTFLEGRYMLIAKDHFIDWSVGHDFRMFKMSDPGEKQEILEEQKRKQELVQRLKASIQYFNEGMWDNRLYYPVQ